MNFERVLIILGGTLGMFLLMLFRKKKYAEISVWKMIVSSLLLAVCGVIGAMLMYFVESGSFGGTSFFGAILLIPVLMLPIALMLRIPFGRMMDLCAPCECVMLAVLKIDCLTSGCCYGRMFGEFQFPSQIVEMIVILIIMVILLRLEIKPKNKNLIYPYYLILYGATRFFLNLLRGGLSPFVWILPAGNFWSLVSVCIGIGALFLIKRRHSAENETVF